MPQVASELGRRWQSGPAYLPEIAVTPLDAASDYVTVRDVALASTSLSRFIRLMIAVDSDGDGLPNLPSPGGFKHLTITFTALFAGGGTAGHEQGQDFLWAGLDARTGW